MPDEWPAELPVVQVRVARPTDRLDEVVRFYCDGLGLKKIDSFAGHAGYTGVMLGLPGAAYHLEFTSHDEGSPCPAPTLDNLLVFYIPDRAAIDRIVERLAAMGYAEVAPENPYWQTQGVTIEDPDGWRVVLMNTDGITPQG
jgi:catechol 2,3-dioxygenase-like lactoylglutathione lyase family enzyme